MPFIYIVFRVIKIVLKSFLWLLLAIIVLVGGGFIFTELNKAYWDAWVDERCAEEGVITVFERVDLRLPDYNAITYSQLSGLPRLPPESTADARYPVITHRALKHERRIGGVVLQRLEASFVRQSDKKVLSSRVIFSRQGGDLIPFDIESQYSCRNSVDMATNQINETFEWARD